MRSTACAKVGASGFAGLRATEVSRTLTGVSGDIGALTSAREKELPARAHLGGVARARG
jgi:hypothetical protein